MDGRILVFLLVESVYPLVLSFYYTPSAVSSLSFHLCDRRKLSHAASLRKEK